MAFGDSTTKAMTFSSNHGTPILWSQNDEREDPRPASKHASICPFFLIVWLPIHSFYLEVSEHVLKLRQHGLLLMPPLLRNHHVLDLQQLGPIHVEELWGRGGWVRERGNSQRGGRPSKSARRIACLS
jgi:hypothetical protein